MLSLLNVLFPVAFVHAVILLPIIIIIIIIIHVVVMIPGIFELLGFLAVYFRCSSIKQGLKLLELHSTPTVSCTQLNTPNSSSRFV